jgi:hypothetical protein
LRVVGCAGLGAFPCCDSIVPLKQALCKAAVQATTPGSGYAQKKQWATQDKVLRPLRRRNKWPILTGENAKIQGEQHLISRRCALRIKCKLDELL